MTILKNDLPQDLFNASRLPARDEMGYVQHPDFGIIFDGLGINDEGESACEYIEKLGYEFEGVSLEDDADDEVAARYFNEGDPDISAWQPTSPTGEGWSLLAIFDSEDGACATFVKRKDGSA
jgi:hypothetical protein